MVCILLYCIIEILLIMNEMFHGSKVVWYAYSLHKNIIILLL